MNTIQTLINTCERRHSSETLESALRILLHARNCPSRRSMVRNQIRRNISAIRLVRSIDSPRH